MTSLELVIFTAISTLPTLVVLSFCLLYRRQSIAADLADSDRAAVERKLEREQNDSTFQTTMKVLQTIAEPVVAKLMALAEEAIAEPDDDETRQTLIYTRRSDLDGVQYVDLVKGACGVGAIKGDIVHARMRISLTDGRHIDDHDIVAVVGETDLAQVLQGAEYGTVRRVILPRQLLPGLTKSLANCPSHFIADFWVGDVKHNKPNGCPANNPANSCPDCDA